MLVHSINFKVKGVTYKNEEGKDIQKEIKNILKEYKENNYFDKLYNGYSNSEIIEFALNVSEYEGCLFPAKIVGDEYNEESCFKIYFKTYNNKYVHVGYAPKEEVGQLTEWITKEDIKVDGILKVIGGKFKHSEIYEEDYEEKERVVTEELNYGIEIELNFYDKQISPEYEKMKEEENKIKKSQQIQSTIETIVWMIFIIFGIWLFSKAWSFINWLTS